MRPKYLHNIRSGRLKAVCWEPGKGPTSENATYAMRMLTCIDFPLSSSDVSVDDEGVLRVSGHSVDIEIRISPSCREGIQLLMRPGDWLLKLSDNDYVRVSSATVKALFTHFSFDEPTTDIILAQRI